MADDRVRPPYRHRGMNEEEDGRNESQTPQERSFQTLRDEIRDLKQEVQRGDLSGWSSVRIGLQKSRAEMVWHQLENAYRLLVNEVVDTVQRERLATKFKRASQNHLEVQEKLEKELQDRHPSTSTLLGQSNVGAAPHIQIHMPRAVSSLSFDGTDAAWPSFRRAFTAEVVERDDLSDAQKLRHLTEACKGARASDVLGMWTKGNFAAAWQRLCATYDDEYRQAHAHIRALLNTERMEKQSSAGLSKIISTAAQTARALQELQQDTFDTMMIYLIVSRLDFHVRKEWETYRCGRTDIPLYEVIRFLENQASTMFHAEQDRDVENPPLHRNDRARSRRSERERSPHTSRTDRDRSSAGAQQQWCPRCKEAGHELYGCPAFKGIEDVRERAQVARTCRVCWNCLKENHYASQCRQGPCRRCSAAGVANPKHNSLLCERQQVRSEGQPEAKSTPNAKSE